MNVSLKGVTRIVFLFDKVVVKIPNFTTQWNHFLLGILANINESKTWAYNSGQYEKGNSNLLCPVLWCSWGGWVLIMKRAQTFTYEEWGAMQDLDISEHKKYFPGDDTMSNYGMIDGGIVKIDYGQL